MSDATTPAPTSAPAAGDDAPAEVAALEALRCVFLGAGDLEALAGLLDDDYLHVHGNGRVTDKAATLARLGTQPRQTERGALTMRVWGDAALIVGEQVNRAVGADGVAQTSRGLVTQTLRRRDGHWRFLSLQFTALHD